MEIDIIDFEEETITVVDVDGNSYTITIDSDNPAESEIANALIEIGYSIMENIPADDDSEDGEDLPYYEDEGDE